MPPRRYPDVDPSAFGNGLRNQALGADDGAIGDYKPNTEAHVCTDEAIFSDACATHRFSLMVQILKHHLRRNVGSVSDTTTACDDGVIAKNHVVAYLYISGDLHAAVEVAARADPRTAPDLHIVLDDGARTDHDIVFDDAKVTDLDVVGDLGSRRNDRETIVHNCSPVFWHADSDGVYPESGLS